MNYARREWSIWIHMILYRASLSCWNRWMYGPLGLVRYLVDQFWSRSCWPYYNNNKNKEKAKLNNQFTISYAPTRGHVNNGIVGIIDRLFVDKNERVTWDFDSIWWEILSSPIVHKDYRILFENHRTNEHQKACKALYIVLPISQHQNVEHWIQIQGLIMLLCFGTFHTGISVTIS